MVPETQSQAEIQILIRQASERGSSPPQAPSQTGFQDPTQLTASSDDVVMTDTLDGDEQLNNEQIEEQLMVIEEEKRRAHLRLRLAEARPKKVTGFPVPAVNQPISEPFRSDNGVSSLALEKGLKSKSPDESSKSNLFQICRFASNYLKSIRS